MVASFFFTVAFVVPVVLVVWYLFSSLGRLTRGVEDIAITLRRIEQDGRRPTL
jgi:hypothetical protein